MFTWKETVVLSLIGYLKDPELVRYFMKILYPMRKEYLLEEARTFHISLRECFREDIEVNNYLPIISSHQMYNFKDIIYHMKYFTPGFIRRVDGFVDGVPQYVDEFLCEKVELVERLLKDESCVSNYPVEEINDALEELQEIGGITRDDEYWLDIPYLTSYNWGCRFGDDYKYIELIN